MTKTPKTSDPLFFTIEAKALRSGVKIACDIIEKRNTIPILSHLAIQKTGSRMFMRATDLDMEVVIPFDLNDCSDEDFNFCVPAHTLLKILSAFDNPVMRVEKNIADDYGACEISVEGGSYYELKTLTALDFPTLDTKERRAELKQTASFTNGLLPSLFKKIIPYISSEETRYYLNGICFHVADNKLNMVATDGHKLIRKEFAENEGLDEGSNYILPRKAVNFLAAHAKNDCKMHFGSPQGFAADVQDFKFYSKLIDGTFPEYNRVIPSVEAPGELVVSSSMLRNAVSQVSAITSERARAAKIDLSKDGGIVLNSNDPEIGFAKCVVQSESIDLTGLKNDGFQLGYNAQYLITMLSGISGRVALRGFLKDPHGNSCAAPTIFAELEDPSITRVLMPMRV